MDTTSSVGLLDFEADFRLHDREAVVDPFIGLKWHLVRSGHPPYTDALRRQMLENPRLRAFLKESDRKGAARELRSIVGQNGKQAQGASAQGKQAKGKKAERLEWTDEEIEALAEKAASEENLMTEIADGRVSGAEIAAKHLVEDITKADGERIRVRVQHCGDHKWDTGGVCPTCRKPSLSEEWQEIDYDPQIALRIWTYTDPVSDSLLEEVFGDKIEAGDRRPALGEALLGWVMLQCERIESGIRTIGEDLAGN